MNDETRPGTPLCATGGDEASKMTVKHPSERPNLKKHKDMTVCSNARVTQI
jgi:hypothetical protein